MWQQWRVITIHLDKNPYKILDELRGVFGKFPS